MPSITSNDDFFFGMMDCRRDACIQSIDAFQKTKVNLIGFDSTHVNFPTDYYPLGTSDDPGLYYTVSNLCIQTGLSVDIISKLIFASLIISGVLVFVFAMSKLLGNSKTFFYSCALWIFLGVFNAIKSDVYIFNYWAISFIPLFIWALKKKTGLSLYAIAWSIALLAFISNYFRSHSGSIVVIFLLLTVVLEAFDLKKKMILFVGIVLMAYIPKAFFQCKIEERNTFLSEKLHLNLDQNMNHPFWHSAYIGFGYFNNDHGLKYEDSVSILKVNSVDPDAIFGTVAYEHILRDATIEMAKEDPFFVFKTLFLKFLICLSCIVFLMSFSIYKLFQISRKLVVPIILCLLFSTLAPTLVVPRLNYLNQLMAFSLMSVSLLFYYSLEIKKAPR